MIFKPLLVLVLVAFTITLFVLMAYYRPTLEYAVAGPIAQSSIDAPTILSDTQGYDFSRYMEEVTKRVRFNWHSLMPEAARLGKKGRVVVVFAITRNGTVRDVRMAVSSGSQPLDRAATAAVEFSKPPALPSDFKGKNLMMRFSFLYNIKSEDK